MSKVKVLGDHFREICPHTIIEERNQLFSIDSADELLDGSPTFVLDCIDNIKTKIELLHYCVTHKIPVLASMGSGAKADPSRIQISDISDTSEDPLARATRQGLKKKGVLSGIPVIYSTEVHGRVGLLPLEDDKVEKATEYSALPDFRSRILPVLGYFFSPPSLLPSLLLLLFLYFFFF
jgi:tRNA A37 threonylcarbamoyladenosine dehydratase